MHTIVLFEFFYWYILFSKFKIKDKRGKVACSPCPFKSNSIGVKFNLTKLITMYLYTFALTFDYLSIIKGLKDFTHTEIYRIKDEVAFIYTMEGISDTSRNQYLKNHMVVIFKEILHFIR